MRNPDEKSGYAKTMLTGYELYTLRQLADMSPRFSAHARSIARRFANAAAEIDPDSFVDAATELKDRLARMPALASADRPARAEALRTMGHGYGRRARSSAGARMKGLVLEAPGIPFVAQSVSSTSFHVAHKLRSLRGPSKMSSSTSRRRARPTKNL